MKIKELCLYTTQIEAQKRFYHDTLDLEMLQSNEKEITFKTGNSILRLIKRATSNPYHLAFNIPSNKVKEALKWLKERVKIQKDGDDEIVDFPAWNAESIYFYDADKNILEFIARKDLNNNNPDPFSSDDLLEISEIGLATINFKEKYDFLISEVGAPKFGGAHEVFCALGSETGLFILIDRTQKDWFPTNDKAFAADFIVKIKVGEKFKYVEFKDEALLIREGT